VQGLAPGELYTVKMARLALDDGRDSQAIEAARRLSGAGASTLASAAFRLAVVLLLAILVLLKLGELKVLSSLMAIGP